MGINIEDAKITPLPVLMIGTYDEEGNANVMNIAWGGASADQNTLHSTSESLLKEKRLLKTFELKREFTVSYATKDTMEISDYLGLFSGNVVDKIEESGVDVEKAENVDAPI